MDEKQIRYQSFRRIFPVLHPNQNQEYPCQNQCTTFPHAVQVLIQPPHNLQLHRVRILAWIFYHNTIEPQQLCHGLSDTHNLSQN